MESSILAKLGFDPGVYFPFFNSVDYYFICIIRKSIIKI